jgi:hypothetical protein
MWGHGDQPADKAGSSDGDSWLGVRQGVGVGQELILDHDARTEGSELYG